MYYCINQRTGIQFFQTEEKAIEYHEEAYFECSDYFKVPESARLYKIVDGNEVNAIFADEYIEGYEMLPF